MATLITETTWHGNPRGTVTYAGTAYVNSVTSPYIHIPSGGSAATVPTYVSRQGSAPMVLTAAIPITAPAGGLPATTVGFFASIAIAPTGVWAKGTTLTITAQSLDGSETQTVVITIPQNTAQDNISNLLLSLINDSDTAFNAFILLGSFMLSNLTFTGSSQCKFTALTITAP